MRRKTKMLPTLMLKAIEPYERSRAIKTLEEADLRQYLEPTPEYFDYYYLEEEHNNQIISVLAISKKSETITALTTKEQFRRQGYATKLLEDYAEHKNTEKIKINGCFQGIKKFYNSLNLEVKGV